jgi:hypothetical protein
VLRFFERMNFFSHAAVARRFSEESEFVLGAMLPDFASMLGARLPGVGHPTLERGVAFHHLTDHAFHELPAFRMLSREAHGELAARGVGRGPARAVAHVGIEIVLDVTLGQSAAARDAYLSGLAAGMRPDLVATVAWPAKDRERFVDLCETLARRGVVLDTSSATIVERIRRTLARRPRLALAVDDPPRVLDWVETARGRIVGLTPALVAELHRELEQRLSP